MQSTARVTSVLALAAAAAALRVPRARALPVSKAASRAVAAVGLAAAPWPAAGSAADEIDEGRAATPTFLSTISKQGKVKKGSGKAAVPVGDASMPDFGRAAPKETAPEIAAADSLLTKKDSLTAEIRESAPQQIGSEAPVVEADGKQRPTKRETPAWVTYKAPEPEPKEAPKKYEPAEPTFTITPKKDDASLRATGDFFASISKKGTVKKGDGVPVARGDSSLPDFGRAAPKAAPAASGDFDALASKVQARYE